MTGAVYDRGYRPYEGERGGRTSSRNALFRASARRALGWRRPWKQKLVPLGLLAIATIPAVVNVGVRYLTRDTPASDIEFITYREYVGVSNVLLLFIAITAPDIICPDRRQRVLPLIFARPLRGIDYVLAKVGSLTAILFAFGFLPQAVLFIGQMFVAEEGSLTYFRANVEVLWQVPVAVAILSLWFAVIGVALSSLTTRRIIAGALIVGLFLVTSITAGILVSASEEVVEQQGGFGPPATVIDEEGNPVLVPQPPPALGESSTYYIVRQEPTAGQLVNVFSLPLLLRDLVFLGHVHESEPISGLANGGAYAVLIYLVVVGVAFTVLFVRYHEVEP